MIPADKTPWFETWLDRHARARLRRAFARVHVLGLEHLRAALDAGPVLVISNHTAWWDALVILWLGRLVLRADGYALMDARNLRRLPFFRKVGAFGVELDDRGDRTRAVRHAARLLDRAGRLVWVFPQGRERPVSARPLGFAPGAAAIARLARGCRVVPAALRYEHGGEPAPVAYVSFGEPLPREADAARAVAAQEHAVERLHDDLDARLASGDDARAGVTLLRQPASRVGALLERLLARWAALGSGALLEPPARSHREGPAAPDQRAGR